MTNNLSLVQVVAAQDNKETTINDKGGELDAAVTAATSFTVDDTNARTMTGLETTRNNIFNFTPGSPAPTGIATVTFPAVARGAFTVLNQTGVDLRVVTASQQAAVPGTLVPDGFSRLVTNGGTNIRASGPQTRLEDRPTQAPDRVRVARMPLRYGLLSHSGAQAISAATDTTLTWDTEDVDSEGFHASGSPTRLSVPPNVRKVNVIVGIDTSTPGSGDVKLWLAQDGSTGLADAVAARSSTGFSGSEGMVVETGPIDVVGGTTFFEARVNFDVAGSVDTSAATFFAVEVLETNDVSPLHEFRGVRARKSSGTQAVSADTNTYITFDAEDFDTDSIGAGTAVFTVPAGVTKVRIVAGFRCSTPSTSFIQFAVGKNGSTAFDDGAAIGSVGTATGENEFATIDTGVIAVAGGDTFGLIIRPDEAMSVVNSEATFFALQVIEMEAPDSLAGGAYRGCLVRKDAVQSETVTDKLITWEFAEYDTDGVFDASTNNGERLAVPKGVRRVRLFAGLDTGAANPDSLQVQVVLDKNGTGFPGVAFVSDTPAFAASEGFNVVSPILDVVEGDFFSVRVFFGDTTFDVDPGNLTWFGMEILEAVPEATGGLYPVSLFLEGVPTASNDAFYHVFTDTVLFPDDFDGSIGFVNTDPSSALVLDVRRGANDSKTSTSIGSISVATTGVFTFSTSGSAVEEFRPGDRLEIVAPADLFTSADFAINLRGLLANGA